MTGQKSRDSEESDNLTPFQRFERLTKSLIAVPKDEVEAIRKKQQAERRRAKARRTT